jgi:hypothetical protein
LARNTDCCSPFWNTVSHRVQWNWWLWPEDQRVTFQRIPCNLELAVSYLSHFISYCYLHFEYFVLLLLACIQRVQKWL